MVASTLVDLFQLRLPRAGATRLAGWELYPLKNDAFARRTVTPESWDSRRPLPAQVPLVRLTAANQLGHSSGVLLPPADPTRFQAQAESLSLSFDDATADRLARRQSPLVVDPIYVRQSVTQGPVQRPSPLRCILARQFLADQSADPGPSLLEEQLAAALLERGRLSRRLAVEPLARPGETMAGMVDIQHLAAAGQRRPGRLPDPRRPIAQHSACRTRTNMK